MKKSSVSQNKEKESQWRAGKIPSASEMQKRMRYKKEVIGFIGSREDGGHGIKKIILNSGGA